MTRREFKIRPFNCELPIPTTYREYKNIQLDGRQGGRTEAFFIEKSKNNLTKY